MADTTYRIACGYGPLHEQNPPKTMERRRLFDLVARGFSAPERGLAFEGARPGDAIITLPSANAVCANGFAETLALRFGAGMGGCTILGFEKDPRAFASAQRSGPANLVMSPVDVAEHLMAGGSSEHVFLAWLDFLGEPDTRKLLAVVDMFARGAFTHEGRTTFLALTFKNFHQRTRWIEEAMDATFASVGGPSRLAERTERLSAWIAALVREAGRGRLRVDPVHETSYPAPVTGRRMHSLVLAVTRLPGFEPAFVPRPRPYAMGWVGGAALPRRHEGPAPMEDKLRLAEEAGHEVLPFLPPHAAEPFRSTARWRAVPRSATAGLPWRDLVGSGLKDFAAKDLTERQDAQARLSYAAKRRRGKLADVPFDAWVHSMIAGRRQAASAA